MIDNLAGASPVQRPVSRLIATQEVWVQTSSDYNAVKHVRTKVFDQDTPLHEVMAWGRRAHVLQAGQVTLTEEDG